MKLYVSYIVGSYKDSIIGNLGKFDTSDILIHMLQYWHECAVDEENWSLPKVLNCSGMMYRYYICLVFF